MQLSIVFLLEQGLLLLHLLVPANPAKASSPALAYGAARQTVLFIYIVFLLYYLILLRFYFMDVSPRSRMQI
jgi:formate hydrogenlyase subunit 3/multisubunit Na+/H+ antiporter MnhD subunit